MDRTPQLAKWEPLGVGVLLYAYGVFLGASYLLSYWRPFGFDIFPYVTAQLLITLPLNRLSVLFAPLVLIGLVLLLNWGTRRRAPRLALAAVLVAHTWLVIANYIDAARIVQLTGTPYENEKSILALVPSLTVIAVFFAVQGMRQARGRRFEIAAVVLLQLAAALAAGYADGKATYVGSEKTFFLENSKLCEPKPVRDWVYLGRYGTHTLFMNTIEKRICVLNNAQFTLIPRSLADHRAVP
jgi:hypothetical protein